MQIGGIKTETNTAGSKDTYSLRPLTHTHPQHHVMAERYKKSQWELNIDKLNTKPEWHLFEVWQPLETLL